MKTLWLWHILTTRLLVACPYFIRREAMVFLQRQLRVLILLSLEKERAIVLAGLLDCDCSGEW